MLRALVMCLLPFPATACEVALALTIDVSSSVDRGEYRLQIDGLADALADNEIRAALIEAKARLTVVQWSGVNKQRVMIPWIEMSDPVTIDAFADQARALPRAYADSDTAPGDAIDFTLRQFAQAGSCVRRVIDVSGDGAENAGGDTASASARAWASGVEINGIAIEMIGVAITGFYKKKLITPGGFVLTARTHEDYPRAIAEKLLREIAKVQS